MGRPAGFRVAGSGAMRVIDAIDGQLVTRALVLPSGNDADGALFAQALTKAHLYLEARHGVVTSGRSVNAYVAGSRDGRW